MSRFNLQLTIGLFLAAGLTALDLPVAAQNAVQVDDVPSGAFVGYVQDEIIVELTPSGANAASQGPSANALQRMPEFVQAVAQAQVTASRRQFPAVSVNASRPADRRLARIYKVKFSGGLETALTTFMKHPFVARAEPIGVHAVSAVPNDPYYDNPPPTFSYDQWHYRTPYGVNAQAAWDIEAGNANVTVAVLDTGVRYWHTDLGGPNAPWDPNTPKTNGNIWVNVQEVPGNGNDDDANGYIDDTIGYDFVSATNELFTTCIDTDCAGADNDPRDGNGHGTHVAGTIAAISNNARGVAGVAGGFSDGTTNGVGNGVKVIPLRIGWHANYLGQETGLVRMDYAAEAMQYVASLVDSGVNVAAINCSWGSSNSGGIDAAVDALLARDVMIMHAAGNSNADSAGYLGNKAGVMNVGATDINGAVASFSNFGSWVDLAAPGVDIVSTYHYPADPSTDYVAVFDGTSMASPHAAGVAALLESYNPALTGADKFALMTGTAIPYSGTKNVGAGIVNVYNALLAAPSACAVSAQFDADATTFCDSAIVNFFDLSTGPITGYLWDFGDGNVSSDPNPSHTYTAPGTYTVSLTVSSAGCSDSETKTDFVTVLQAPTAAFSANPVNGSAPLSVNFTDLSTEQPSSWSWDFGDGGSSILQNPSHDYATPGTYTVSLTVSNACGSDATTSTDLIVVDEAPANARAFATADISVSSAVQGSYLDTHTSDNAYETITELVSNGRPDKRRSSLEHRWTFSVAGAAPSALFVVEAYRTPNAEGDDFRFEYSPDGSTYIPLVTVASDVEQTYAAVMPDVPAGTVYIRVVDTDSRQGNSATDSIVIDEMYIETSQTVNSAPTVSITSPADGANYASGATVSLVATASDNEDGDVSASIEWSSDRVGLLGTGPSLNVALIDGPHVITATAYDSTSLSGEDSVSINVGTPQDLIVLVSTDQPSYPDRATALITTIAFDGVNLVEGANMAVELITPKGRTYTASGVTDLFGIVQFTHTINARKDGSGTYTVNATVNAPGFNTGTESATFLVP